jgi:predicted component of type VI protein secretion system
MIKIEVTGNSIPEVADKLLAIGASLQGITTTMPVGVAEAAPVDPTLNRPTSGASVTSPDTSSDTPRSVAPKSAPAATVTESQQTTAAPSSTPAPAASVSEDEELEVVDLPIAAPEVNLRDLVLSVVEKRGKPVMEEILSRFGVPKASMVGPERLPELIALCNEALSK